eukprot:1183067-Prorocentrum_minimum.AAC.1
MRLRFAALVEDSAAIGNVQTNPHASRPRSPLIRCETQSDEEAVAAAMEALKGAYPEAPAPVKWAVSRWGSDKFARGAGAYLSPGASGADYDAAAAAVAERVLFAGEHTYRHRPASVEGAVASGHRAALQALKVRWRGSWGELLETQLRGAGTAAAAAAAAAAVGEATMEEAAVMEEEATARPKESLKKEKKEKKEKESKKEKRKREGEEEGMGNGEAAEDKDFEMDDAAADKEEEQEEDARARALRDEFSKREQARQKVRKAP